MMEQLTGLANPEYLFLKSSRYALLQAIADLGQVAGKRILDIGSGSMAWKEYFFEKGAIYVGVDLNCDRRPHAVMQAEHLAVAQTSCEVAICLAVLEHADEPQMILNEIARILRPQGRLVLQTHGIYPYHPDPQDHWRWTHTGIVRIIKQSGLQVRAIYPSGNALTTYLTIHVLTVDRLLRALGPLRWTRFLVIPLLNLLSSVILTRSWLQPKTAATDPGSLIMSFAAVAVKPR